MCRFHVAAGADTTCKTFSGAIAKVSKQQPWEVVSFSYWLIKPWYHN
jgi:hypothetical protein